MFQMDTMISILKKSLNIIEANITLIFIPNVYLFLLIYLFQKKTNANKT